MSLLENVLNRIKFPIALWENINDNIVCSFTNNKLENLIKGTELKDYINYVDYKDAYSNIFELKNINIKQDSNLIVFSKINNKSFYELHYPECNSWNILCTISNKIRSPLQNIIGMLLIIENSELSTEQQKYFNIIRKSSYDIVGVVNDIIDIANLEKDKIKLEIKDVSLKKVIDDVVSIVSEDITQKKIIFKSKIDPNLPQIISIDKPRFEQILLNILNNAIKFTKYGFIEMEVFIYRKNMNLNCPFPYIKPKEGEFNIVFKIKDTGNGMIKSQKDVVNRILEIDSFGVIKSHRHFGFGLMISNYLCKLMGGKIWYKSEPEIGSIFYFNILCKGYKLRD